MSVQLDNSAIEKLLRDARAEALTDAADTLIGYCLQNVPVGKTGNLRRSHRKTDLDTAATEIHVVATAGYALYVHEPTKPHDIPNAFGVEGLIVEHPGTKGQPWMTRSVDQMAAAGAF